MDVRVGELFAGIAGFRYGLEASSFQSNDGAHESEHKETGSTSGNSLDIGRDNRQTSDNGVGGRQEKSVSNNQERVRDNSFKSDERQATFRVVWANEIDRYACQVYRKHYGNKELVEGDIRDVKTADIPDIDLLCAGFPCQTFSYAGERSGIGTARGTLFAQIARVASAKRPKLLLLENVRGILSSSNGRDFAVILRLLGSLGYILQWEVLDSQHHGVPQHRERVFIIGHLGTKCFRQIFPLRQNGAVTNTPPTTPRSEGQRLRSRSLSGYGQLGGEKEVVADTVNSRYYKCGPENLVIQQHSYSGENGKGRGYRVFDGYVPTLATQMGTGGNNVPMVIRKVGNVFGKGENGDVFDASGICRTLKSGVTDNPNSGGIGSSNAPKILIPNGALRRLTPVECERLQSFPDGWTAEGLTKDGVKVKLSDTQRYKLLGNAVSTCVVKAVAERLFD